jgi:branched-subunit amino acid ABC-type transport system permease component
MSLIGPALVDGVIISSLYGLLASGLVIIYTTSGVINFAQGALAIFAVFVLKTLTDHGVTFLTATLVAVAVGALIGVAIDRLTLAPVRQASALNRSIITIGWLITLQYAAVLLFNAGVSTNIGHICDRCSERLVSVGGLGITAQDLVTVVVTVAVGAGLALFFRRTYTGVAMRAASQDVDATRLMGVSVDRISALAWGLGGALATIGGILITPRLGALDSGTLTVYLIQSLAAALLGGLRSLPRTAVGALVLGMSQELIAVIPGLRGLPGLKFTVAFVVILVALVVNPDLARATAQVVSEKVVEPVRARWWTWVRWTAIGLVALFLLLVGIGSGGAGGWFGDVNRFYWAQVFGDGCIFLSLVLLTGFVGQISLCQFTFAGFGAFFTAILTARWGLPFLVAVPLAALCTAPIGMLIGIPALRVRGLQLAVVTLAFTLVGDQLFFAQSFPLSGGAPGQRVDPVAGPVDLSDPTAHSLFWTLLAGFLLAALAVGALQRSPSGRAFFAVRDSENAATAMGISLTRTKLTAFSLAAGIAGLGGGLFALTLPSVSSPDFNPGLSITFLALIILAGIRSVWGALVAATFYIWGPVVIKAILAHLGADPTLAVTWQQLLSGVLLILTVILNPSGIVGSLEELPLAVVLLARRRRRRGPEPAAGPGVA